MKPGDFVLGSTVESLRLHPTLACRLDGRSTLARLGLLVHCTSETIDSIHQAHRSIVLEIANVGPFQITMPFSYAIGWWSLKRSPLPSMYHWSKISMKGKPRLHRLILILKCLDMSDTRLAKDHVLLHAPENVPRVLKSIATTHRLTIIEEN